MPSDRTQTTSENDITPATDKTPEEKEREEKRAEPKKSQTLTSRFLQLFKSKGKKEEQEEGSFQRLYIRNDYGTRLSNPKLITQLTRLLKSQLKKGTRLNSLTIIGFTLSARNKTATNLFIKLLNNNPNLEKIDFIGLGPKPFSLDEKAFGRIKHLQNLQRLRIDLSRDPKKTPKPIGNFATFLKNHQSNIKELEIIATNRSMVDDLIGINLSSIEHLTLEFSPEYNPNMAKNIAELLKGNRTLGSLKLIKKPSKTRFFSQLQTTEIIKVLSIQNTLTELEMFINDENIDEFIEMLKTNSTLLDINNSNINYNFNKDNYALHTEDNQHCRMYGGLCDSTPTEKDKENHIINKLTELGQIPFQKMRKIDELLIE